MSTKSPKQKQRAAEIKAVRKLRDVGLISKHVKLTTKPTRAVKSALRRFADVVTGKAAVIKVPKHVAKGMRDGNRVKGNLVVIEKQKGERFRFDPDAERIVGTRRAGKRTFTRTIERDVGKIKPPRAGTRRYYVVPFNRSGGDIDYLKFDDLQELNAFMAEYEKRGYKNWKNYIEVVDVHDRDELEEEYPSLDTYKYREPKKARRKTNRRGVTFGKPVGR